VSKRWLVLCCVAWIAGCAGDRDQLVATEVLVPAPLPGRAMTAGYFTLVNHGDRPVIVTRVSSPQFNVVELHESIVEDGISRMRRLHEVSVPARGSVQFAPGGKHLMLMQPVEDIAAITLNFYTGDTMILTLETRFGS
jgi:copper(I)-binding protein